MKPQYGCIKKILLADYPNSSNYPNKGKIIPRCRFGYTYGTHPDKSDKQLATQSKVNQVKPYKHFYPELRRGKGQKIQFHVKGSPGRPDILGGSTSFDGINDLLNQIEKRYLPHSIEHLVITNHSGAGGNFPTNEKGDEQIQNLRCKWNKNILERLKKVLSHNAILELRMCRGGEGKYGVAVAQDIANTIGCNVIVYENKVNSAGGKAPGTFLLPGKRIYRPKY